MSPVKPSYSSSYLDFLFLSDQSTSFLPLFPSYAPPAISISVFCSLTFAPSFIPLHSYQPTLVSTTQSDLFPSLFYPCPPLFTTEYQQQLTPSPLNPRGSSLSPCRFFRPPPTFYPPSSLLFTPSPRFLILLSLSLSLPLSSVCQLPSLPTHFLSLFLAVKPVA